MISPRRATTRYLVVQTGTDRAVITLGPGVTVFGRPDPARGPIDVALGDECPPGPQLAVHSSDDRVLIHVQLDAQLEVRTAAGDLIAPGTGHSLLPGEGFRIGDAVLRVEDAYPRPPLKPLHGVALTAATLLVACALARLPTADATPPFAADISAARALPEPARHVFTEALLAESEGNFREARARYLEASRIATGSLRASAIERAELCAAKLETVTTRN